MSDSRACHKMVSRRYTFNNELFDGSSELNLEVARCDSWNDPRVFTFEPLGRPPVGNLRHCILSKDAFEYYTSAGDRLAGKKPLARFPLIPSSSLETGPAGATAR